MRESVARLEPNRFGHHRMLTALRVAWTVIRLPALAILVILEPVARLLLAGFALLMTLTAFFWLAARGVSGFAFWRMLGIGVGAWLLLALYHALMRWLSS